MSGGIDDRLTALEIDGLETWLAHVDPDDPVQVTQLVIDAIQALVEEVRERRAGAIGDADVVTLEAIRRFVASEADTVDRGTAKSAAITLLDRLLDRLLAAGRPQTVQRPVASGV